MVIQSNMKQFFVAMVRLMEILVLRNQWELITIQMELVNENEHFYSVDNLRYQLNSFYLLA